MKSHVYLNPMSPDGKPGEVMEMEVNDGAPQYLEPFVENDATGKLRHNLHEAQAKLRHAKARGKGVPQAQAAVEAAKSAMDTAHRGQQKAREQQKTGSDYGAPSPFSRDTRQFAEIVSYADDYDDNDEAADEADDEADDALEAKLLAAVTEMEKAQSEGAPQSEVLRLAEVVRVLREQLHTPLRETDPPRKRHIDQNPGGEADTGAIEAPFPGAKKLRDSGPATRHAAPAVENAKSVAELAAAVKAAVAAPAVKKGENLSDVDRAARSAALAARRPRRMAHAKNVCCTGKYLCSRCQAKAATV